MPIDQNGKRYEARDSGYFGEEISSIGMSMRPSASASSGELNY